MVCVSYLLVCYFLIYSQKKRAFSIKHRPKTTCFPAPFTSWNLWNSLLCKDCLAACRTLLHCFESLSILIKAKQNVYTVVFSCSLLVGCFICLFAFFLRREIQNSYFSMHISLWHFQSYCILGWTSVGYKKTHWMQIKSEFTSGTFVSDTLILRIISLQMVLTKGILSMILF